MKQTEGIIERIRAVSETHQHLDLAVDESLMNIKPGQFMLARLNDRWDPFLRTVWYPVDVRDSRLVVDTITKWAAGWASNGWRRKSGPVQNLDLVRALYDKVVQRPEIEVRWIKAHAGHRWNEYADGLANAWRTSTRP